MTPRVVYDTNVVVSATLKAGSIPASLVTLALDRRVRLCLSPIIFAEYEVVLKRPKFAFDAYVVDAFRWESSRPNRWILWCNENGWNLIRPRH